MLRCLLSLAYLRCRARVSKQLMISVTLLSCRCYIDLSASGSSVLRTLRRIELGHYLPHSISSLVCTTTLETFVACPETRSLVLRAATYENAISSTNENLWLPSRHNCVHHFLPHRTLLLLPLPCCQCSLSQTDSEFPPFSALTKRYRATPAAPQPKTSTPQQSMPLMPKTGLTLKSPVN